MAICTYSDIQTRLGKTFSATQQAKATAFIVDATALVEAYLGYTIEADDAIVEVVQPDNSFLLNLSHYNIRSITSVVDDDGSTVDSTTYYVPDCGCLIRLNYGLWASLRYTVTYAGGWNIIPQPIKTIIIDLATERFKNFTNIGRTSVKVGQVAYTYSGTDLQLSEGQTNKLNNYRCGRIN